MRGLRALGLFVLAALQVTAAGAAVSAGERTSGSLPLRPILRVTSTAGPCPPGVSSTTECYARRSVGRVAGRGDVLVTYTYLADLSHPSCAAGSVKILEYPARIAVPGKGELQVVIGARPDCFSPAAGLSVTQSFEITGGTGAYAGAIGSGSVARSLGYTNTGAAGRETWTGTLTVPGLEFDVAPPKLSGATSRLIRAPRGAKTIRVAFRVSATDDRDGSVAATCSPRPGSRFKVGRTRVTCTAVDGSGNAATAAFWITVR